MQTMTRGYRSLSVLWQMHGDTAVMTGAIAVALGLGGGLLSLLTTAL
ncbi:MAG: hypothetical protein AAGB05_10775 [Pseudomonadota bacterium]